MSPAGSIQSWSLLNKGKRWLNAAFQNQITFFGVTCLFFFWWANKGEIFETGWKGKKNQTWDYFHQQIIEK